MITNVNGVLILPNGVVKSVMAGKTKLLKELREIAKLHEVSENIIPACASELEWLIDYTRCMVVWVGNGLSPTVVSEAQKQCLYSMQSSGELNETFILHMPDERHRCEFRERFKNSNSTVYLKYIPEPRTYRVEGGECKHL